MDSLKYKNDELGITNELSLLRYENYQIYFNRCATIAQTDELKFEIKSSDRPESVCFYFPDPHTITLEKEKKALLKKYNNRYKNIKKLTPELMEYIKEYMKSYDEIDPPDATYINSYIPPQFRSEEFRIIWGCYDTPRKSCHIR